MLMISGVALDLNAVMRRIDLLAKLLAPVFISAVDGFSHVAAIWVVFGQNLLSVLVEYFAIAQVYEAVPRLQALDAARVQPTEDYQSVHSALTSPVTVRRPSQPTLPKRVSTYFGHLVQPWVEYVRNRAFLASFSLSLLYFTVLSTGVQIQTYLFTLGFTSLEVSVMRLAAVAMELLATWAAPILMNKIGPVRSGLWFLNEQFTCIAVSVILYLSATAGTKAAGYSLIAGVTFSRLGLWGFDLSVQYLVQEEVSEENRGKFSAAEMALQNVSELISFATTIIWARPEDFEYPVLVSAAAVGISACCFAAFVRKRRGHLLHASKCMKREKYVPLPQTETPSGVGQG
ncbi:Ferroporti-1 [Macrophomina phaseolina MS6]|uniref:Solute carrier family 40 member n=1 Tax=Macrophomina phaseolina (strain MS6) TaxID=1126212 RepID=K2RH94_MACPH|nr:Ferroporti-1 [Macrophomina phaseolina MS6]